MSASHPYLTKLFGSTITLTDRAVMRFEPLPANQCGLGNTSERQRRPQSRPDRTIRSRGGRAPGRDPRACPLVLCAVAIDVGNWYVQAQMAQKAADAAALGGVTYMPYDYPAANLAAIDLSGDNGFPDSGTSTVQTFSTGRTSELGVTVSTTVQNTFGAIFGNPDTTITRTAIADYQGPAIMGSPCNAFANQPPSNVHAAPPATGRRWYRPLPKEDSPPASFHRSSGDSSKAHGRRR